MNAREKLLIDKYGKIRGSQTRLSKDLNVEQAVVSKWFNEMRKPGPDLVIKLAKIFNKSEDEIKEIFGVDDKYNVRNEIRGKHNIGGGINQTIVKTSDLELLKEKIEKHDAQIALLFEKLKKK